MLTVVSEGSHEIGMAFDSEEEKETFKRALYSHEWIRVKEVQESSCNSGIKKKMKIVSAPAHEEPPLTKDIMIQETWFSWKEGPVHFLRSFGDEKIEGKSFYVQHITGYATDSAVYSLKAKTLEDAGFSILRSKRGNDGLVWEIWYLPGAYAAKGQIKGLPEAMIISWLCQLGVGKIAVDGQHWGLSPD